MDSIVHPADVRVRGQQPSSIGIAEWRQTAGTLAAAFTYVSRDLRVVSSLNPHPSGARKHSKINDMPRHERERVLLLAGWRTSSVVAHRKETPTAGIALLLFAAPRPAPRSSCILVSHFPGVHGDPATPCMLRAVVRWPVSPRGRCFLQSVFLMHVPKLFQLSRGILNNGIGKRRFEC